MLFFLLSKIFWGLFAPSHVIVWTSIAAAICLAAGWQRAGRNFAVITALLLIFIGIIPTAIWLLRPLEFKYTSPEKPLDRVTGILTLGGSEDEKFRLTATYALARQYPSAYVVYSGGSNALIGDQNDIDSQRAKSVLLSLGLDPHRLIVESRSRNTWENILYSQALVKPEPGQTWILATSAVQMPRAMEVANQLNWKFVPWPTNWYTGQHVFSGYFLVSLNLGAFDEAIREWVGLYAYRWAGKAKYL
jgi:uncharacterized SAM-binding protein YcdF (DUF218 family)